MKVTTYIFRVFTDHLRNFGNPVAIILDEEGELDLENRLRIANKINFSETVFVNNITKRDISIFNPLGEVEFAGHALVGTSYFFIKDLGVEVDSLQSKESKVEAFQQGDIYWISSAIENTPKWIIKQLDNVGLVEDAQPENHTMFWSWIDEAQGIIRARTFAPDWGIPEDEANGSGSMQLASILRQKIEVHHGKGSVIYAEPKGEMEASVGGRVKEDLAQEIEI